MARMTGGKWGGKKTLKHLREEREWSLQGVIGRVMASSCPVVVDAATLDRIEQGTEPPTWPLMRALAEVFQTPTWDIGLDSSYRLVDVRGHNYILTTSWKDRSRTREARVREYERSTIASDPTGLIRGIEPATTDPGAILGHRWTGEGMTDAEALDALERRIRDALDQAFGASAMPRGSGM